MWDDADAGWAALDAAKLFLLTRPSDATPLAAILLVPLAAICYYALRRPSRLLRFQFRRMFKFVLSRRYLGHRSHVLDVMLMAANIGIFALMVGQATLSMTAVSTVAYAALVGIFGDVAAAGYSPWLTGSVWGIALFLAYELAYWLDHYLSHNVPFLWEFHKVHHTAEVLSPLTNFRVHPIDSLVFVNIVAILNGLTTGFLHWVFGAGPVRLEILNDTLLIGLAVSVFAQLQHTHIWIALTGIAGKLILSPAHHQIHHSMDPKHHNKNLGNLVAVFDWVFGTLYIPTKQRQRLVFGLEPGIVPAHDLNEGLVQPFADAARVLLPQSTGTEQKAAQ